MRAGAPQPDPAAWPGRQQWTAKRPRSEDQTEELTILLIGREVIGVCDIRQFGVLLQSELYRDGEPSGRELIP